MAKYKVIEGGGNQSSSPLEPKSGGGDNGGMDDLIRRVGHLEQSVESIKDTLTRLEPHIIEMHSFATALTPTLATKVDLAEVKALVARTDAIIPTLATKADLADKPGKAYLWTVFGVITAAILAAVALGVAIGPILQKAAP